MSDDETVYTWRLHAWRPRPFGLGNIAEIRMTVRGNLADHNQLTRSFERENPHWSFVTWLDPPVPGIGD